jgi:hypothetical protein
MISNNFGLKKALLLLLGSLLFMSQMATASKAVGYDKLSDTCKAKLFPISSGGSNDERVSCTLNFHDRGLILVAGNTTSDDYAPAANDHAFVYAVDWEGNWQWGKFFYNVSFAVSTISGCSIDGNGNAVMLGMGNSVPIIMEVNPMDGTVLKFMSFDKVGATDTNMPWYATYGAIHHDLNDPDDGLSYYYAAFIMDDAMQVVKVNSVDFTIKWNF